MQVSRQIGRWRMTALVVNGIIGSAIFGVPAEAIRLVGQNAPLATLLTASCMGTIVLPAAEVASRFSDAGGMYLYARSAFGRLIGLQVGWFWLLAIAGGGAAGANLFLTYLTQFLPQAEHGWMRVLMISLLVAVPAAANYFGVRQGVNLSVVFTAAKIVPIALLIMLGLFSPAHPVLKSSPAAPSVWLKLLLILMYGFSGWEDALMPAGEVQQPRRTLPFALLVGLLICGIIYTAFQFVITQTAGSGSGERPVIETASLLLGNWGGPFVAIAIMLSTYGWLAGAFLNASRFPAALAQQGDCPVMLGELHPRYKTPYVGILLYTATVLILALTGTFLWAIALTSGAITIFYAITCAALIKLRRSQPAGSAFRAPFGPGFAMVGIGVSLALLTQLEMRQLALMSITAVIAAGNWMWAIGSLNTSQKRC